MPKDNMTRVRVTRTFNAHTAGDELLVESTDEIKALIKGGYFTPINDDLDALMSGKAPTVEPAEEAPKPAAKPKAAKSKAKRKGKAKSKEA